jgi:AAA+ ATPase superfamily predicted ATPase
MFIGRADEIAVLKQMVTQSTPHVAVIYGRRRVGKTSLIREALGGVEKILFFEGLEEQSQMAQIDSFLFQLRQQVNIVPPEQKPKSWRECLALLTPILRKEKYIVVFDEFQWMANYRHTLVSDLKMIWDQYWSQSKIKGLILCGSIASFMVRDVIKSKAFYGRIQTTIHLKELTPGDVTKLLPRRSAEEKLLAMMHFGGIPLYLQHLNQYLSLSDAINQLCFKPNGYFVEEYQRIFLSHFGKSKHHMDIVECLSQSPHGLSRMMMSKEIDVGLGGTLSANLDDLESAGFITTYVPFDKPDNSRLRKYVLTDPYLNFYFAFIKPNLKQIKSQNDKMFSSIQGSPAYYSWLGIAFEHYCIRNSGLLAKALGFDGINYRVGPYFKPRTLDTPGMQIDLLFDRSDQTLVVCEMKYSRTPIKLSVAKETERKIELLRETTRKTILPILISNIEPSKELAKSGYFYKTLRMDAISV